MDNPTELSVPRSDAGDVDNLSTTTCPGCRLTPHPGLTCRGLTADQVTRALIRLGAIYVALPPAAYAGQRSRTIANRQPGRRRSPNGVGRP